jgi:DNA polymerase I-like protein with 3'-5' exonuclease and polymerase domains
MSYKRTTTNDIGLIIERLKKSKGWVAIDTETDGLHLKQSMPFLLTISFEAESYAVELQKTTPPTIQKLLDNMKHFDLVIGHNIKFDLHMLRNYGVIYKYNNLADTMTMARLSLETDEMQTIALKALAKKYLSAEAGDDELQIKAAMMALKRHNTSLFKLLLKEKM